MTCLIIVHQGHDDAQLIGLLVKHFKKNSFKDWQLCNIKATPGGKNTLVVQPTGSGKSLCFQFPCTLTGKMTVVLFPTVSLIMDQVKALESTGLKVTFLGTMQKDPTISGKIAQAQYDIVLSTPESFFDKLGQPKPVFRSLAVLRKIGLIAIDEAHLVRTWRVFRYVCVIIQALVDEWFRVVLAHVRICYNVCLLFCTGLHTIG